LPIIQSLARLMGGDIEAQSEKGRGTTTRITIPCKVTVAEKKREEK
jgi:signal transduction histidine kinase